MSIKTNTTELQEILESINSLPDATGGGVDLPSLSNPATSSDILSGKEAIDGDGNVVTGSMATATQAIPSITVNSSGLITASATQSAGYVPSGTKSATKQLAFQAAKTITPSTTSQIAVSSGYYTGGSVTVKGDSNLIAGNIKSGVSIFGVSGTYVGSGSGSSDTSIEDAFVTKNLSVYVNDRVNYIGSYVFYDCNNLTSVSFPNCTTIGSYAFYNCYNLTSVSFPNCTTIGSSAFDGCYNLTSLSFPNCTTIYRNAFDGCYNLTSLSFPNCTTIGSSAFYRCSSLTTIYLMSTSICTLSHSYAFSSTGITPTTGYIYVPTSLRQSYKTATNWTYFSNRIFPISESDDSLAPLG